MERTGAVIAAAGLSSRMGDFKPLLPFGKLCIAGHLVEMLQKSGAAPIVIVTGYRGEELENALKGMGVHFVHNDSYASSEMLDSLKLGFSAIKNECAQILVMPVDVPAVTENTVRKIMEVDSPIVRTRCGGKRGHPVKLKKHIVEEVMSYHGEDGLKGFMRAREDMIAEVFVYDEGSFLDADTKDEYRELLELKGSRGQGYPDGEALRWLLETSQMPEHLKCHSEVVSKKACSMAVELQKTGIMLDLNLIRAASLLHDIGKGKPDHAAVGAELLRSTGYPAAAEIVRQHHNLDRIPEKANETLVVYLADKMVQGDKEVSIEERFERSFSKCEGNREAIENHERRRRQAMMALQVFQKSFAS